MWLVVAGAQRSIELSMCAHGPNFGISALCETTDLGALGLIQALEQRLAAQEGLGGEGSVQCA